MNIDADAQANDHRIRTTTIGDYTPAEMEIHIQGQVAIIRAMMGVAMDALGPTPARLLSVFETAEHLQGTLPAVMGRYMQWEGIEQAVYDAIEALFDAAHFLREANSGHVFVVHRELKAARAPAPA